MLKELARIAKQIFYIWVLWEVAGQGRIWYARDFLGATYRKDKGEAVGVGREILQPTRLIWLLGKERGKGGGLATKSLRRQHCPKEVWARPMQSSRQSCPPVGSCFLWTTAPYPHREQPGGSVALDKHRLLITGGVVGSVTQLCSFSKRSEQCISTVLTFSK